METYNISRQPKTTSRATSRGMDKDGYSGDTYTPAPAPFSVTYALAEIANKQ